MPSSRQIREARKLEIAALYRKCEKAAAWLTRSNQEKLHDVLVETLAFVPVLDPSAENSRKYTDLLTLLRQASNNDARLYVLASCLKHENVCRPLEFLPKDVFRRLTSETRRRVSRIPWNDSYYAFLIKAWLPYCEAFLSDLKFARVQAPNNPNFRLRELGYQDQLVHLADRNWRSAAELTFAWLAQSRMVRVAKKRVDSDLAKILRNAWSRQKHSFQCAFCQKWFVGEMLSEGKVYAVCCAEHTPDHLPSSLRSAWRDRSGRLWWRDGGKIRCSILPK